MPLIDPRDEDAIAYEVVISSLKQALRDMHQMVHDHVYRSGSPKGYPPGSRIIGPEVLRGINDILRKAVGRNDESLKYFDFPDDPKHGDALRG
jgi:hypothetical protein